MLAPEGAAPPARGAPTGDARFAASIRLGIDVRLGPESQPVEPVV
jgi:hypothetical protein